MARTLLVLLLGALIGANVVYFLMTRDAPPAASSWPTRTPAADTVAAPAADAGTRDPLMPPAVPASPSVRAPETDMPPTPVTTSLPADVASPATTPLPSPAIAPPSGLVIPVSGVSASQLQDTFTDARGEGRVHDAIDIMAATGTPVVAVADGTIEKLFTSAAGGLTIYQFEPGGRYAYYYAHLDRYAPGVAERRSVRQGDVIGYVGSTGNADPAAPHLHFAIFALGPQRQWWKGDALNPYPVLRAAR